MLISACSVICSFVVDIKSRRSIYTSPCSTRSQKYAHHRKSSCIRILEMEVQCTTKRARLSSLSWGTALTWKCWYISSSVHTHLSHAMLLSFLQSLCKSWQFEQEEKLTLGPRKLYQSWSGNQISPESVQVLDTTDLYLLMVHNCSRNVCVWGRKRPLSCVRRLLAPRVEHDPVQLRKKKEQIHCCSTYLSAVFVVFPVLLFFVALVYDTMDNWFCHNFSSLYFLG